MENEASVTGVGVSDFVAPSKKKVIKSTFRKRASLRLTETRSSVFGKLGAPWWLARSSVQGVNCILHATARFVRCPFCSVLCFFICVVCVFVCVVSSMCDR